MEKVRFSSWIVVALILAIQQGVLCQPQYPSPYPSQNNYNRSTFSFENTRYYHDQEHEYLSPRYRRNQHDYYTNSDYVYGEYDVQLPQYSYKPYSECQCSRVAYEDYRRYQAEFRYHYYDERYPTYTVGQEYREDEEVYSRVYNAYHSYDPILTGNGKYPNVGNTSRAVNPGARCYHFNKKHLPKRKPCPKKPKSRKCVKNRLRKEYRQLTTAERESLHKAMNKMKKIPFMWNTMANQHIGSNSPWAHGGASFLPWHREYLFRLEQELYRHGYKGPGLPYWDSSLDQTLVNPSHSAIWTEAYLGNIDGVVNIGPFKNWETTQPCQHVNQYLYRNGVGGIWGQCLLFSDFDISYVMSRRCFRDLTCNTDCKFESDHGAVHNFVGGHMGLAPCAPNDPVFYLHHAFIDCLWEEFRQNSQVTDIYTEYPSLWSNGDDIGSGGVPFVYGYEWFGNMQPFGLRNGHGITNWYEKYYKCHPRPWRCRTDKDCKGDLLWCHNGRCKGKVRKGGDCNGYPNNACDRTECLPIQSPVCQNKRCGCAFY